MNCFLVIYIIETVTACVERYIDASKHGEEELSAEQQALEFNVTYTGHIAEPGSDFRTRGKTTILENSRLLERGLGRNYETNPLLQHLAPAIGSNLP